MLMDIPRSVAGGGSMLMGILRLVTESSFMLVGILRLAAFTSFMWVDIPKSVAKGGGGLCVGERQKESREESRL